jgi:hypothetical protein
MFGSPNRTQFVSPGDLTPQHRQVAQRCEDCHVAGSGHLNDWIHTSFDARSAEQQSALCLKCHRDLGAHPLAAHGVASGLLAQLREESEDQPTGSNPAIIAAAKGLFDSPVDPHVDLSCATCHREHHGANRLMELTNRQCQVCHNGAFDSFAHGHPELHRYPYDRRTRLYFDHLSHFGKHFREQEDSSHSCIDCHVPDEAGRYMLVRDFEQTCASCHAQQIEDDSLPGIVVAAVPALDVEVLQAHGAEIGQWPVLDPYHVEAAGELVPLYQLLLLSEDEARHLDSLIDVDLSDLRGATPEQLDAVESLVWEYKEMFFDILQGGHPELHRRLTRALGDDVPEPEIKQLTASLPLELFEEMQRRWLPNLANEVQARRGGNELAAADEQPPRDIKQMVTEERRKSQRLSSGWSLHASSLSLRYRPVGHADPLLKNLLDVTVRGDAAVATNVRQTLARMHQTISSPFSIGRCMKCHTAETDATGSARINWHPYRPPLDRHDFTVFNHEPHLMLLSNEACSHCHLFSREDTSDEMLFRPEFITSGWKLSSDASQFTGDFSSMIKSNCSDCHAERTGRDRCLTCHNYHIR